MTSRYSFLIGTALLCSYIVIFFAGCAPSVSSEDIYRHKSEYTSHGARDLQVETSKQGSWNITNLLDKENSAPVLIDMASGNMRFFPDALGSTNIKIVINKDVGYTDYAGLKFKQEATVNIWKDGIVEVNKEGIVVSDNNGASWISKKVKIDNSKVAIIIVRKK
jgi:hypothetical protein